MDGVRKTDASWVGRVVGVHTEDALVLENYTVDLIESHSGVGSDAKAHSGGVSTATIM